MIDPCSDTAQAIGSPVLSQFVNVWTLKDGKAAALQQHADTLGWAVATGCLARQTENGSGYIPT